MRAVVAVDPECRYEAALTLLSQIQFAETRLDLVNIYRPLGELVAGGVAAPHVGAFTPPELLDKVQQSNYAQAEHLLLSAARQASHIDPLAKQTVLTGPVAATLMQHADESGADLICASAHHHGALQCFVLGSVCRALVLGAKQSVLIAKGNPEFGGAFRIVVATDHSDYANRCIDRFFELQPSGLDEVTVLSVVEPENYVPFSPEAAQVMVDEQQQHWEFVERRTEALRQKFERIGAIAHSKIKIDDPKAQISETMRQTGANLLVVGAQGHGFFERMTLGSVSLHQVVAENYPVLIMRI